MPGSFLYKSSQEGFGSGGPARVWCVTGDWCGYVCVGCVWFCTLFVDYCTTRFALQPLYFEPKPTLEGWLHLGMYQSTILVIFATHLTAAFSDPGLVPKDDSNGLHQAAYDMVLAQIQDTRPNEVRVLKRLYCKKCRVPKPRGAHHCSTCQRCIHRLDHHCPWVNNCVGERNVKAFCLFLAWVTLGTTYSMVMFLLRGWQVFTQSRSGRLAATPMHQRQDQLLRVILCVVAFIACLFFCVFVLFMAYDQYEAATTGQPGIDALQSQPMSADLPKPLRQGLRDHVCHEPCGWRWFCPTAPPLPAKLPPSPPGVLMQPLQEAAADAPQAGVAAADAQAAAPPQDGSKKHD
jgi:hypothetical protein